MKLALALVAALSLAACVDEPTDPAAGLYGVGIGKAFQTDPTQLVSRDEQPVGRFGRFDLGNFDKLVSEASWIEEFTGTDWDQICKECGLLGLHMGEANKHEVLVFTNAGKFIGSVTANAL